MPLRKILQWRKSLGLRKTLLSGFALVLSFAVFMAIVTIIQVQSLSNSFDQLERTRARSDALDQINLNTASFVAATLDQVWSGRVVSLINDYSVEVRKGFDQLKQAHTDPAFQQEIDKLRAKNDELISFLRQTAELDAQGRGQEARANWIKGSILFQDFNQDISRLWKVEEASTQATYKQAADTRNQAFIIILICVILSLLAAAVLGFLITNSIVGRARIISRAMRKVTDGSDLTSAEIEVQGKDELAAMAQAFNQMINKLGTALTALESTGQTVSSSSEHFSFMMHRQLAAATQEAQAVGSIVSAAGELNQTAQRIDQRAESVAGQARDNLNNLSLISRIVLLTSNQATKTHEVTETVSAGISRMFTEISSVSNEVQDLVEQLSSIRRIGNGLKEIAKNTHLLSLNASIESASAGEHGERFRVVAGEVKNLAYESQKLVDNMRYFMESIEARVENVLTAISETDRELTESKQLIEKIERIGQEGNERANELVRALDEISSLVNATVSQTQLIAQATREQRIATEQIISTIKGVDVVVNENMHHYQSSASEVTRLNTEVRLLNSLVNDLSGVAK